MVLSPTRPCCLGLVKCGRCIVVWHSATAVALTTAHLGLENPYNAARRRHQDLVDTRPAEKDSSVLLQRALPDTANMATEEDSEI